jgi:cysteine desulfurase / selenocysteine lyase
LNVAADKPVSDVHEIRRHFPVLHQEVNGRPLVYFDNAATTQKPSAVIEALSRYYSTDNANIHRGIHTLSERATASYELTRKKVASFLNASEEEVIFTYGTTDSINLVARAYGNKHIKVGDEIVITTMEHHSNIVPWQMLCEETGAVLRVVPIDDRGELVLEEYEKLLNGRTRLVALIHVSNALGTINPVDRMTAMAHAAGAVVLLDGAQAAQHLAIDVKALNCDFYAFSAHKLFGPTGVGVLYGRRSLLESMQPYRTGGEMIREVSFEGTTFNDLPYKFEAGTPHIAGVVAFAEALQFLEDLGKEYLLQHEQILLERATALVGTLPRIRLIGTARQKIGVLSFTVDGLHHFDLGMMLDARGIAVRTGHHCAQPLMRRFGIEGTVRASFSVYNTLEEIDYFAESLQNILRRW